MSKNIIIKLIIYIVEAKKYHENWNLNIKMIINETETSDMFFVSDTKESTNLFIKLMSFVSDTE